jgi:hypothetical protein
VIRLTRQAREELRAGEALVFEWHRVAVCCACAGEVSLRRGSHDRIVRSATYRPLPGDSDPPVYAHRQALPHLARRDVVVDCRRTLGVRRFTSDLPPDFGLRASLGRLPDAT